jgi:hypothetical protein
MPDPRHGHHGDLAWTSHRSKSDISKAWGARVRASSERAGDFERSYVNDEQPAPVWSSVLHETVVAEEWVELKMPYVHSWSVITFPPGEDGWRVISS